MLTLQQAIGLRVRGRGAPIALFSPSSLFENSEVGVWYDPSDIVLGWRRNLLTRTSEFNNAAWLAYEMTIAADATTAPDGTTSADSMVCSLSGYSSRYRNEATVANTSYTLSVYAKSNATAQLSLELRGSSSAPDAVFDLDSGTLVSGTGTIVSVGNGWYRCSISKTITATSAMVIIGLGDPAAANDSIYIWGAQLETGSTATAYQPITDGVQDYLTYDSQPVMYQNSTGTTPVTGLEQPVGLLLDKSKGLTLGSELDPGFSSYGVVLTGTWVQSGGNYVFTDTVGGQSRPGVIWPSLSLSPGWYRVVVSVASITGATQIRADGLGSSDLLLGTGTHTFTVYVSAASTPRFRLEDLSTTINDGFALSSVSVKALPGNHAYQSTSTARPVLRARYNLLTYSEQFDNVFWIKNNVAITPNATTAPDGTNTADKVTDTALGGSSSTYLQTNYTFPSAGTFTVSFYLKAADLSWVAIRCINFAGASITGFSYFDLANGVVGATNDLGATIESAGAGWYRCQFDITVASGDLVGNINLYAADGNGDITVDQDGTSSFYVWGAQVNIGSTATTYQRIEAAPTGNGTVTYATGAAFPPRLEFDGTDDALLTASINFSATDEMSVFAGVTKNSDGTASMFAELSASISANNGSFAFLVPTGLAVNSFNFATSGTIIANNALANQLTAPITGVLTGLADISADINTTRKNGSLVQTVTTDQGTGNFGNYPLYIGSRAGTSAFFNGSLYSLIVRGKTSTATEIQSTENYVAGKLGRSITWAYDYLVDDAGNFITTDGGDQIYVAETVTFT